MLGLNPLRFGAVHVLGPLVTARYEVLAELRAEKSTKRNEHEACNFLADVTRDAGIYGGIDPTVWSFYPKAKGGGVVITNTGTRDRDAFSRYCEDQCRMAPHLKPAELAESFVARRVPKDRQHQVSDDEIGLLFVPGVPDEVVAEPLFRETLKRFWGATFPPYEAERMALQAFERERAFAEYIPKLSQAFDLGTCRDKQEAFVSAALEAARGLLKGLKPLVNLKTTETWKIALEKMLLDKLDKAGFPMGPLLTKNGAKIKGEEAILEKKRALGSAVFRFTSEMAKIDFPNEVAGKVTGGVSGQ